MHHRLDGAGIVDVDVLDLADRYLAAEAARLLRTEPDDADRAARAGAVEQPFGRRRGDRDAACIVDRPGATQTQLRVATVGAPRQSPDYYAIEVMNAVLGGTFASRINMNLREEHGYTYGAGSGFAFRRGAGPFQVATGVRTDVTAPAVSEILKEVRRMNDAPASAEELTLAKDGMTRSLAADFQTSAASVGVFGNLYIYDLGLDYFRGYASGVNAVTADQALAAARTYVAPGRLVVIAIGDRTRIEPGLKELGIGPVEVFTP